MGYGQKDMESSAEKTYIAGDDDQAIFKWAGADVDHFIALKEEVDDIQTLDQSYRIPGGPIHELVSKNNKSKYKIDLIKIINLEKNKES